MTEINILSHGVDAPQFDLTLLTRWVEEVAADHGRKVGRLTYVFCDDEYILQTNREFLQHDYYTDIITFDYSTTRRISGDMVISLDTVRSNAQQGGVGENNDKGPGEREVMEQHENAALAICPFVEH